MCIYIYIYMCIYIYYNMYVCIYICCKPALSLVRILPGLGKAAPNQAFRCQLKACSTSFANPGLWSSRGTYWHITVAHIDKYMLSIAYKADHMKCEHYIILHYYYMGVPENSPSNNSPWMSQFWAMAHIYLYVHIYNIIYIYIHMIWSNVPNCSHKCSPDTISPLKVWPPSRRNFCMRARASGPLRDL